MAAEMLHSSNEDLRFPAEMDVGVSVDGGGTSKNSGKQKKSRKERKSTKDDLKLGLIMVKIARLDETIKKQEKTIREIKGLLHLLCQNKKI